jgi:Methionine biosynthesis protein MetW
MINIGLIRAHSRFRRSVARCKLYVSACKTLFVTTNISRWRAVAVGGTPPWDKRNEIIAGFIADRSSVLDLGCGAQTLRTHLKPQCKYQPCDVVRGTPGVTFCDFNAGIYPDLDQPFDYVVCSGLLEYIRKPREFLDQVCQLGQTLLVSYHVFKPSESKLERLARNWVTHMTRNDMERVLQSVGLEWKILAVLGPNEIIYEIHRPSTDVVSPPGCDNVQGCI